MGEEDKQKRKKEIPFDKDTLATLKNLEANVQESEQKMENTIDTFKAVAEQSVKTLKETFEETKKKSKL